MSVGEDPMGQLTADFNSPQVLQSAYSQMLQHAINRALGGGRAILLCHHEKTYIVFTRLW